LPLFADIYELFFAALPLSSFRVYVFHRPFFILSSFAVVTALLLIAGYSLSCFLSLTPPSSSLSLLSPITPSILADIVTSRYSAELAHSR